MVTEEETGLSTAGRMTTITVLDGMRQALATADAHVPGIEQEEDPARQTAEGRGAEKEGTVIAVRNGMTLETRPRIVEMVLLTLVRAVGGMICAPR